MKRIIFYVCMLFLDIFPGHNDSVIIPIDSTQDIHSADRHSEEKIDDNDTHIVQGSIARCFKGRRVIIEKSIYPFFIVHIERLRSLFDQNESSGSSSAYGTPVCEGASVVKTPETANLSLSSEVDDTIKEAVAQSVEETFISYETRIKDLEYKLLVQEQVQRAHDDSSTPRERKRALIMHTCTALISTVVTATVTYFAAKDS